MLASRLVGIINNWLASSGAAPAKLLEGVDLELAVARGAAYYGQARQGNGVRIRGGIANAYYVGIESSMPAIPGIEPPMTAICVAPFGMEEGTATEVPGKEFHLRVGEAVKFKFFGSSQRREDEAGEIIEDWEPDELLDLPDIQARLPVEGRQAGDLVKVRLASRVTEIGTLCLEAVATDNDDRWLVEFDVRN